MDLNFTTAESIFRDEVRAFLKTHLPADLRERMLSGVEKNVHEDIPRWQKILHVQGWGAPGWPVEFGGTGWTQVQQYIFEVECALAGAPPQLSFGLKMVAPVLMRFGSPAQQQRFLPRIRSAEEWWCQGYSEPGSGSDLASLKTQARREGEHYVVNGQKVWNTLGQYADWIFCLVRTDMEAKPQRGISFLLIDMKTPGITVRPTTLLDGTQEVNEIWFDNVRVPLENRVGEENQGWTYAKFLLGHERTNIAGIGTSKRELERLKRIARAERKSGRPLIEDPVFAARIAQVEIELTALEITNLRVISEDAEKRAPGPEASILKIKGTEIMQRISELQIDAIGSAALPFANESERAGVNASLPSLPYARSATASYLNLRKVTIFGGSNEIQKNIIAQMILGL
jgi:alkylation response protein AidB-like acyl-CoA dehydrogenase